MTVYCRCGHSQARHSSTGNCLTCQKCKGWMPKGAFKDAVQLTQPTEMAPGIRAMTQAERDAILRRMVTPRRER